LQWKQAGLRQRRKTWSEWINIFLPAFIYYLTKNFTYRNTIGEYDSVAYEYLLINRGIACEKHHLTRYIKFSRMRGICARISLGLALPTG
jgi:hypothetical protein